MAGWHELHHTPPPLLPRHLILFLLTWALTSLADVRAVMKETVHKHAEWFSHDIFAVIASRLDVQPFSIEKIKSSLKTWQLATCDVMLGPQMQPTVSLKSHTSLWQRVWLHWHIIWEFTCWWRQSDDAAPQSFSKTSGLGYPRHPLVIVAADALWPVSLPHRHGCFTLGLLTAELNSLLTGYKLQPVCLDLSGKHGNYLMHIYLFFILIYD